MVCMSRAFVYDVVDVNKIVAVSSTKPPSYAFVQVTAGLKLSDPKQPSCKKSVRQGYGEKRCKIQGGGQEMAVMVG